MPLVQCDLCFQSTAAQTALQTDDAYSVTCETCGAFEVTRHWKASKPQTYLSKLDFANLRGVVRHETDLYTKCQTTISNETYKNIIARAQPPRGGLDQMQRFILHCAEGAPMLGVPWGFLGPEEMCRLYFEDLHPSLFKKFLGAVHQAGLLLELPRETSEGQFAAQLSVRGWEFAERATRGVRRGSQAFVAMWFHPEMDAVYENGIAPALRACGYSPYRVDRQAHENKIDDEIVAQIRRSRLMVADLTGLRPNAFYEAGFAHGLDIPMILTCNQSIEVEVTQAHPTGAPVQPGKSQTWFRHVAEHAFDIRQYTVLGWNDPVALAQAIETRIRALNLALD